MFQGSLAMRRGPAYPSLASFRAQSIKRMPGQTQPSDEMLPGSNPAAHSEHAELLFHGHGLHGMSRTHGRKRALEIMRVLQDTHTQLDMFAILVCRV